MRDVLDDIRLDEVQVLVLKLAAEQAGGELDTSYAGSFRPVPAPCLALRCHSPAALVKLSAQAGRCPDVFPLRVLSQLSARVCEDGPDPAGTRVYYWPGVLAA